MRSVLALAALSVLALPTSAFAGSTNPTASFNGIDEFGNAISSGTFTVSTGTNVYTVNGTTNSNSDSVTFTFNPPAATGTVEYVYVSDPTADLFDSFGFGTNGNNELPQNPDGSFNVGTFLGSAPCLSSVRKPRFVKDLSPALGFLQFPITCGGATLDIVAPTSTSVTPEPSTLALLTTGMLGVVGTVRRRYRA